MAPHENIDTVSKAAAYVEYTKLQQFLDAQPACVNETDASGYYPLQWAALNNRVAEATFLLQRGALVNAVDHTGQTSLHWASVRGSLPVLETLLRNGGSPDIQDNRGYTAAHVAAQYGQTAVLYHLALKWGVDMDTPDADGRTPLHWAAYKGYADTLRLLLVLEASCTLADKEGCTALHWAAIKGNGEACTVLLQGGSVSVLTYKDVTGSTPAQLAVEKGHRYLGLHLAEYKQKHEGSSSSSWWGKSSWLSWLTGTQLCPVIWLIGLSLMALYSHKVMLPGLSPPLMAWSWSVMLCCSLGLFFLYKTTTADPGFIPSTWTSSSSNPRLKALDSPALWAGNWHQLCVSCHIVRPLRAKHCSVTDRCIEVFDHYCPWVGNAIGKGNRHWFILFLWLELYGLATSAIITCIIIHAHAASETWDTSRMAWMVAFVVADLFVGVSVAALAVAQASQIARNVTTNELANWHRYKYLQTADGSFHNPFSKGIWANCAEAFNPGTTPMAPVYLSRDAAHSPHTGCAASNCSGCSSKASV
ncbi:ankyrin repeat-containing domain protein [Haematococcus lacustris]